MCIRTQRLHNAVCLHKSLSLRFCVNNAFSLPFFQRLFPSPFVFSPALFQSKSVQEFFLFPSGFLRHSSFFSFFRAAFCRFFVSGLLSSYPLLMVWHLIAVLNFQSRRHTFFDPPRDVIVSPRFVFVLHCKLHPYSQLDSAQLVFTHFAEYLYDPTSVDHSKLLCQSD